MKRKSLKTYYAKRDEIATHAMVGLLSYHGNVRMAGNEPQDVALQALQCANALMILLERHTKSDKSS